ncbi:SulP family inorganic anion transporter [Kushneria phyllosphaerae]|uniref:C4-dicarboxylic acid transporter DauA n=1 Tax=Kushneria phyllosphaerae TaxID=2100822 RepID=A0A2R8CHE7_9GAMM|nr:SulP family inorganic anion transporter [Kushneria phyllosphaerae]SPJ32299.1 C4-dicarboxylic acid transporter DauA [Kushneria phyllosphaerae]
MSKALSLKTLPQDLPAGVVVFLVAIPLCLGISLASGAPPLSGLIAGIIGGLVVSMFSGSSLSVSGPAAGLTVIVLSAVEQLGLSGLFMATVLAGALQLIFGFLRLGKIGAFVPSAVIKGMLAAIGLILILNQIPLALGLSQDSEVSLLNVGALLANLSPVALAIAVVTLGILVSWEKPFMPAVIKRFPAALVAVLVAIGMDRLALAMGLPGALEAGQRISLPGLGGPVDFIGQLQLPVVADLLKPQVYMTAVTLALVASLETLLSLEAVDKIDPLKRHSPPHRELKAQGIGNMVSGMVGGLPITAVIVRSSANVQAGGRTRLASFVHGLLLLCSVAFVAGALEFIPLACLAAVLVHTGYKLARPATILAHYHQGWQRFVPFAVTVVAIMVTNLLEGVIIGFLCGLYFLVRANYHSSVSFTHHDRYALLRFHTDVSFLNRDKVRYYLDEITDGSHLIIDAREAGFIDPDIQEDIDNFVYSSHERDIVVELKQVNGLTASYPALRSSRSSSDSDMAPAA